MNDELRRLLDDIQLEGELKRGLQAAREDAQLFREEDRTYDKAVGLSRLRRTIEPCLDFFNEPDEILAG